MRRVPRHAVRRPEARQLLADAGRLGHDVGARRRRNQEARRRLQLIVRVEARVDRRLEDAGRGYRTPTLTGDDVREIMQLRRLIEPAIARVIVKRGDEQLIAALRDAVAIEARTSKDKNAAAFIAAAPALAERPERPPGKASGGSAPWLTPCRRGNKEPDRPQAEPDRVAQVPEERSPARECRADQPLQTDLFQTHFKQDDACPEDNPAGTGKNRIGIEWM